MYKAGVAPVVRSTSRDTPKTAPVGAHYVHRIGLEGGFHQVSKRLLYLTRIGRIAHPTRLI